MTKMYVLAKCIITFLGVYVIGIALRFVSIPVRYVSDIAGFNYMPVIAVCFYFLLCLVIYFSLFRNRDFARRFTSPPESNEPLVSVLDFVKALRITVAFAGLMLLSEVLLYLIDLPRWLLMLRALLFAAFGSKEFSHQLPKSIWSVVNLLLFLFRICFVTYLILGAPACIGWQVRTIAPQSLKHDTDTVATGE